MFISTILMVVVLVVALSTATFAWYTAQSTVMSTDTTLTSATSTSASIALSKTDNGAAANGSKVTLTMNNATTVAPMVPKTAYVVDTTTYDAFKADFFNAPVNNAGVFTSDGIAATPSTITQVAIDAEAASSAEGFYVINTNGTTKTGANVAVTINETGYSLTTTKPNDWATNYASYYTRSATGNEENPYNYTAVAGENIGTEENPKLVAPNWAEDTYYVSNAKIAADLRVAVFSNGTLKGIWAKTSTKAYYGTITEGNNGSTSLTGGDIVNSTTTVELGDFNPLEGKYIQIVAWFDGVGLVVDDAGLPAVFSLTFNASAVQG